MQTATQLLSRPDYSFRALASHENSMLTAFLEAETATRTAERATVTQTAVLLELLLLAACVYEAAEETGADPLTVNASERQKLWQRASDASHLDAVAVANEAVRLFRPQLATVPGVRLPFAGIVRMTKSVLEACPTDSIESWVAYHGLAEYGHRFRVALDGLQAFVLRNDSEKNEQVKIAGRAYAQGSLSIEEVARLLSIHPVDAVALMERHGFVRSLSTIQMSEDTRSEALQSIRADRRGRRGDAAQASQEHIARDVVASERIEGVDARRWITRDVS